MFLLFSERKIWKKMLSCLLLSILRALESSSLSDVVSVLVVLLLEGHGAVAPEILRKGQIDFA